MRLTDYLRPAPKYKSSSRGLGSSTVTSTGSSLHCVTSLSNSKNFHRAIMQNSTSRKGRMRPKGRPRQKGSSRCTFPQIYFSLRLSSPM
ncbi:hypothetical protein M404DRAFT_404123 [Pisolithus tinctorius Marx 270]|uniref:Uncharacterized protein n=1 Tax=Pisolithus tinctorius Marx 270 TaxID=870435 RepID=A0A0C3NF86_PISTI|nr:hypothetical protein M404DRAFT_404123 [Pisolithus tinctorius Marx 270]